MELWSADSGYAAAGLNHRGVRTDFSWVRLGKISARGREEFHGVRLDSLPF